MAVKSPGVNHQCASSMSSSTDQIDAWKQLVHLLPTLLPEQKNKERVKLNFAAIKDACAEEKLEPSAMFRRLKHAASTVVRELARERFNDADALRKSYGIGFTGVHSSSSESENEDESYIRGVSTKDLKKAVENDVSKSWEYHAFINNPTAQGEFEGFLDRFVSYMESEEEPENGEFAVLNETEETPQTSANNNDENTPSGLTLSETSDQQIPQEPSTPRPAATKSSKYTCNRCNCPVSKASVQYCRPCRNKVDREKKTANRSLDESTKTVRTCNSCGSPISTNSKGLCKPCHLKRRSGPSTSIHSASTSFESSSGKEPPVIDLVRATYEVRMYKNPATRYRITCRRCNNDRVHFAQQMCQTCYKAFRKENNLIAVKRETVEEPILDEPIQPEPMLRIKQEMLTPSKRGTKRPLTDDYTSEEEGDNEEAAEQPNVQQTQTNGRKTKTCLDCNTPIYPESDRCKHCFWELKKRAKLQQSSTMDTSTHPESRKTRECLRCNKTISIHGKTGFCHQCYFDNQKECEQSTESANKSFNKENQEPPANGVVLAGSGNLFDTPKNSLVNQQHKANEASAMETCVVCDGSISRRSTTGTCSKQCYQQFYSFQKKDEQPTPSNEIAVNQSSSNRVVIEERNIARERKTQTDEVTMETVQRFFEPAQPCQLCWGFEKLNQRRLCENCHKQEFEEAQKSAKCSNKTAFSLYLEKTEQYLDDD